MASHTGGVGRYAPSPTGDLHFGSLIAAVASFCQTKHAGGQWLLRIDDLDTPRVVAGSAERIIQQLALFGMTPDAPVVFQSDRSAAYARAIDTLKATGQAFDCGCTRREAQSGAMGPEGPIYPGTCRQGLPLGREPRSVRLRVRDAVVSIDDAVQGSIRQNLATDIGDFVIRRADDIAAYQLATVVDDAWQGVTEVTRGADLLSSSPRQRYLQHCLGQSETNYCHVPVIVDENGEKLGKSNGAIGLDESRAPELLRDCLQLLGQSVAVASSRSVTDLLEYAVREWDTRRIPAVHTLRRSV